MMIYDEHEKVIKNNDKTPKNIKVVDKRFWAQKNIKPEEIGNESAPFDEKSLYPTYVTELEDKVKKSEQQLQEYIKAYKELKEQQEGFRLRMQKLKEHDVDEYRISIFNKFIEIIDDLERALVTSKQFNDSHNVLNGVELAYRRILKLLQSEEVEIIQLENMIFDPKLCEPVSIEPTTDESKNDTISEVILPGYKYKVRVIRPAKVKVYKVQDSS